MVLGADKAGDAGRFRPSRPLKRRYFAPWLAETIFNSRTGAVFATALSRLNESGVPGVGAATVVPCDKTAWWLLDRSQSHETDPSSPSADPHSDEPVYLPAWYQDSYQALREAAQQRLSLWSTDDPRESNPPEIVTTIEISGNPIGLVGARVHATYDPSRRNYKVVLYKTKKTRAWQNVIIAACRQQYRGEPINFACRLYIVYRLLRPRNDWYLRKRTNTATLRKTARALPTTVPDLDNLDKTLIDGLVKAGVLKDDRFVTTKWSTKRYTPEPGTQPNPGVTVTVAKEDQP